MIKFLFMLFVPLSVFAIDIPPTAFPVFLKAGYSTILEFDESPSRVVLGDSQSFQVERLDKSLVIKTLNNYGASNMFVYFKERDPRLFVLTASEDAQPTYYKKFETEKVTIKKDPPVVTSPSSAPFRPIVQSRGTRITQSSFDSKKDYLTIETLISSDSKSVMKPNWSLVRLTYGGKAIAPFRLWAERKDVQKDSTVKARFIFVKPNLSRDLAGVNLVIPLLGETRSISIALKGGR